MGNWLLKLSLALRSAKEWKEREESSDQLGIFISDLP